MCGLNALLGRCACMPKVRDHVRALDEQFNITSSGRTIKLLLVMDDFTSQSLSDLAAYHIDADVTIVVLDKSPQDAPSLSPSAVTTGSDYTVRTATTSEHAGGCIGMHKPKHSIRHNKQISMGFCACIRMPTARAGSRRSAQRLRPCS